MKLDRDSTDEKLIIDVFAHDAPGLLYTITKSIFDLDLSIDLAKIATHFDQVLDVFYVRESNGRPVTGTEPPQGDPGDDERPAQGVRKPAATDGFWSERSCRSSVFSHQAGTEASSCRSLVLSP